MSTPDPWSEAMEHITLHLYETTRINTKNSFTYSLHFGYNTPEKRKRLPATGRRFFPLMTINAPPEKAGTAGIVQT